MRSEVAWPEFRKHGTFFEKNISKFPLLSLIP